MSRPIFAPIPCWVADRLSVSSQKPHSDTMLADSSRSGFQSTQRGNPLAQKIVAAHVAMGANDIGTFYSPDNCKHVLQIFSVRRRYLLCARDLLGAFLNDTIMPVTFNYDKPTVPFVVNGKLDPTSQRFHVSLQFYNITLSSLGS
jgi:hypothetical protein